MPTGTLGIICNSVVLIGMLGSRLWTRNQYLLIINLCLCDLLSTTWWTVGGIVLHNPSAPEYLTEEGSYCRWANIFRILDASDEYRSNHHRNGDRPLRGHCSAITVQRHILATTHGDLYHHHLGNPYNH